MWYKMKECFGNRPSSKDKPECSNCPDVEKCSFETVIRILSKRGYGINTSMGKVVHIDDND